MAPPRTTEDSEKAKRLGAILRRKREEAGIGPVALVKISGVSRSYLAYLEQGKFAEVGLDKFSRIVKALGLSTDEVLAEAGYLPKTDRTLPEPTDYLRQRFGLTSQATEQAISFLEYLSWAKTTAKGKKK